MKMCRIIASMVAMLFAATASAQSPNNGVWAIGDYYQVYRWNSSRNEFQLVPGTLKQVSVGTDGEVWGVSPADDVFRWTGSDWQQLPGQRLKQLSVRNAQEAWGVNAANEIFRWNGADWQRRGGGFSFVSVGVEGTVWVIADGNLVDFSTLRRIPSTPDRLTRIMLTGNTRPYHDAWAIDDNAQLFRRTPDVKETWEKVDGAYLDVAEAPTGNLWTLTSDGRIFFSINPGYPQQQVHPGLLLKQIAVGAAGPAVPAMTADQQLILDTHNNERRNYPGVGALQWSPELAQWAQEWAQSVANANNMTHRKDQRGNPFRPGEGLGENIYGWNPANTGADAVMSWIAEKQWYNYAQDTCAPGKVCGHYTQVVWKNSQYVGCGKATSANGTQYYVCNYYPPGNTGGRPY